MEEIIQKFTRLQKNKTKIFSVTKCELSSVRPCCTCYSQPLKYIFDPLGKSESLKELQSVQYQEELMESVAFTNQKYS